VSKNSAARAELQRRRLSLIKPISCILIKKYQINILVGIPKGGAPARRERKEPSSSHLSLSIS
jgi:hypothetical protein